MKKTEVALITLVVIVCIFRFFTKVRVDTFLAAFENKKVVVEGVVIEEPENRTNGTRVLLSVNRIFLEDGNEFATTGKTKTLSTVRTSLDLEYGDVVLIEGILEKPEVIVSEDGRKFDYPSYLGKDSIFYLLKGTKIDRLPLKKGNVVKKKLLAVKHSFIQSIDLSLPEPHSLLASGLVVAGKGALSEDLSEQFKRVGLIHIVVLSGSNVTIIADAIIKILSFLPRLIGSIGGVLGIVAFTVIAGTSATVVRSAIMSIVVIVGKMYGGRTTALRSLIVAACGMALINPDIVVYDPSFQLSFTGTLGLITFSETTGKWFGWITERGGLREIISASVASQISLTPMILHMSGMFSFVSLIVNILVLPLIPLTMLSVFLTGCIRFISPFLAEPFSIVSYGLLSCELYLVSLFSDWKYAATTISALSWFEVLLVYLGYLLIYICHRIFKKLRQ